MSKFTMRSFSATRHLVKAGIFQIMEKISDFSWHFCKLQPSPWGEGVRVIQNPYSALYSASRLAMS